MSDWSIMMINTAAEMKGKTEEQVLRKVVKESGTKRVEVLAALENKPSYARKNTLVIMLAKARHQAAKRADLIRDRRQTR